MEPNDFNGIDEFFRLLGYERDDSINLDNSSDNKNSNRENDLNNLDKVDNSINRDECSFNIDKSGGVSDNCCANADLDIPGGFQNLTPTQLALLSEIIGNILSANLPFNVANAISNFIILIGQILESFGTQQQYYEVGPGRLFNCANKNVDNPFCSCSSNEKNITTATTNDSIVNGKESNKKKLNVNTIENYGDKIKNIEEEVKKLTEEFYEFNNKIKRLEKKINKICEGKNINNKK